MINHLNRLLLIVLVFAMLLPLSLHANQCGRAGGRVGGRGLHIGGGGDLEALVLLSVTTTSFYVSTEMSCEQRQSRSYSPPRSSSSSSSGSMSNTNTSRVNQDSHIRQNILPFFSENYEWIKEEAAKGEGMHLDLLADRMGCSGRDESYEQFHSLMKSNFNSIFLESPSHADAVDQIIIYINADDLLSSDCSINHF